MALQFPNIRTADETSNEMLLQRMRDRSAMERQKDDQVFREGIALKEMAQRDKQWKEERFDKNKYYQSQLDIQNKEFAFKKALNDVQMEKVRFELALAKDLAPIEKEKADIALRQAQLALKKTGTEFEKIKRDTFMNAVGSQLIAPLLETGTLEIDGETFRTMPVKNIFTTKDGRVTGVNRGLLGYYGFTNDNVIDKTGPAIMERAQALADAQGLGYKLTEADKQLIIDALRAAEKGKFAKEYQTLFAISPDKRGLIAAVGSSPEFAKMLVDGGAFGDLSNQFGMVHPVSPAPAEVDETFSEEFKRRGADVAISTGKTVGGMGAVGTLGYIYKKFGSALGDIFEGEMDITKMGAKEKALVEKIVPDISDADFLARMEEVGVKPVMDASGKINKQKTLEAIKKVAGNSKTKRFVLTMVKPSQKWARQALLSGKLWKTLGALAVIGGTSAIYWYFGDDELEASPEIVPEAMHEFQTGMEKKK